LLSFLSYTKQPPLYLHSSPPWNKMVPEVSLRIATITSKWRLHLHFHFLVLGVYLGSSSSHDVATPSSLPFCFLVMCPIPYQLRTINLIIIFIFPHHFTHYSSHWEVKGWSTLLSSTPFSNEKKNMVDILT
jgi:hypothetical protein